MTAVAKTMVGLDELGFTTRGARKTFAVGILGFLAVAFYAVYTTAPAWHLLGVGRPVVPEAFYPLTALAVLLFTTILGAITFAGLTMSLLALWQVLGKEVSFAVVRIFAGLSYLFVTLLPTIFIHLYGLPRLGLAQWLQTHNPDAYQVLFGLHRVVDLSHFLLAIVGIGILWGLGDKLQTSRVAQAAFVVVLLFTFFGISVTLGFHSALAGIHIN